MSQKKAYFIVGPSFEEIVILQWSPIKYKVLFDPGGPAQVSLVKEI